MIWMSAILHCNGWLDRLEEEVEMEVAMEVAMEGEVVLKSVLSCSLNLNGFPSKL